MNDYVTSRQETQGRASTQRTGGGISLVFLQFISNRETDPVECLRVATALLLSTIPLAASAQTPGTIPIETAQTYFLEAQSLCQADHGQLWGVSLCGPIMFVDPQSRTIVANQSDAKGQLKAEAGVFVGFLPTDQNIANTAVEWSGVYLDTDVVASSQ
jgi:hypothetical protein